MPLISFFGCLFTAYGPILSLFVVSIGGNAQLVILALTAAFFWLLSLLIISILWFLIKPLQDTHTATLAYSVVIQELFRYIFYFIYSKAERGLISVSARPASPLNRSSFAFASGIGYGIISSATSYITLLASTTGPGMLISPSCPAVSMAFTSGLVTMLMSLLHVTWMLVAFDGFGTPGAAGYIRILFVFASHLAAAYATIFNGSSIYLGCLYSVLCLLALLVASSLFALKDLMKRWK
ncbi:gamma-secretase subunit Aph-1 [Piptocephalis cylindrospora]|uniref:Gamma-secretase subunit Aph-1 n=1 Tax=Piptocephalis cylindrospora TaxID=1907219 RepID=A0A4P9Y062_9FUNG|nr:gamma-secretase subunit Aph-1 [Piptocephalis cylindrospora]|eukprot:RKP12087.1 gamma-secretase subunit Aph-1 [Piptocephalis cylindrospora]